VLTGRGCCHAEFAHPGDEVGRVVGLVGTDRDATIGRHLADHRLSRLAFGGAGGQGNAGIHHQAVAVRLP
jgi:hypothetical protein